MSERTANRSGDRIVIERTYDASLEDIWKLWTTAEGIESWWGPGGFYVKVHELDLRPGGQMRYAMTARDSGQVEFMKQAGMPLTTEAKLTYTEIVPEKSIAYTHRADFIPGVEPYDVGNRVEFFVEGNSVRMVVTLDPMHTEEWTRRASMGMESQMEKFAERISAHRL
jgi:uncharacterized protein YndB with AHSA1/START domain